jgi:hypothetical protein
VPGAGNSQAYDRYAYSSGNPVKYIDPTGHSVECGLGDPNCYAGRLSPQQLIFERHQWLVSQVKAGEVNDLEAFAQLTEYAAAQTPDCTECFVQNLGAVLTGHDQGHAALNEMLIQGGAPSLTPYSSASYSPYYQQIAGESELMQSGYAPIFQDPDAEGGNQAHHFWFYVQVGFESGAAVGVAGAFAHETVLARYPAGRSYEDYALGVEGAMLGQLLEMGIVNPGDVGDYIRTDLSPGSASAQIWDFMSRFIPGYR